jgi:hypothetical protein
MNKITKTLAIVGVVLAIGTALSSIVPQVAFAQSSSSSAASSTGGAATQATAFPDSANSCGAAGPAAAAIVNLLCAGG